MSDNQAILAASILASQGSLDKLQTLLQNYTITDQQLLLSIFLILIPELQPLSEVATLLQSLNQITPKANSDAIIDLVSNEPNLIEILEVPADILSDRVHQLRRYLGDQSRQFGFLDDNLASFVEARVRKTLAIDPDIHFNDPLFELISHDQQFQNWSNGIVVPFEYLLSISNNALSLEQFEKLSEVERISTLLSAVEIALITTVDTPLISLIQNSNPSSLIEFLETNPPSNIRSLQLIIELVRKVLPTFEPRNLLIKQTIVTFYNYDELSETALDSISDLLAQIQQVSNDSALLNISKLTSAAKAIQFHDGSLKDLDGISKDKKAQEALFHSILEEKVNKSASADQINQLFVLRQTIFTQIDLEEYNRLIVQRLLSLKSFHLLSPDNVQEDQIIDYFWKCFKRASNGSKHRGEILNASHALKIVQDPSSKILNLKTLIDSIDALSHYSLYFKNNTPSVPADLLTVGSTTKIIERALELNPNAYLESDKLLQISKGLSQGLELEEIDQYQLDVFCITNALANDDFDFAYETSIKLLEDVKNKDKLRDSWSTFFQVGKFFSPEWSENEDGAPEEVIKSQLDLLAKVLKVCPTKNTQVVVAQWSSLDMELSLR